MQTFCPSIVRLSVSDYFDCMIVRLFPYMSITSLIRSVFLLV